MDRRGEEKVKLGYGKSWVYMSLLEDCQVIMSGGVITRRSSRDR